MGRSRVTTPPPPGFRRNIGMPSARLKVLRRASEEARITFAVAFMHGLHGGVLCCDVLARVSCGRVPWLQARRRPHGLPQLTCTRRGCHRPIEHPATTRSMPFRAKCLHLGRWPRTRVPSGMSRVSWVRFLSATPPLLAQQAALRRRPGLRPCRPLQRLFSPTLTPPATPPPCPGHLLPHAWPGVQPTLRVTAPPPPPQHSAIGRVSSPCSGERDCTLQEHRGPRRVLNVPVLL